MREHAMRVCECVCVFVLMCLRIWRTYVLRVKKMRAAGGTPRFNEPQRTALSGFKSCKRSFNLNMALELISVIRSFFK